MDWTAEPGRVIGGRYRLIEELASGGFGRVWKAHDETLTVDVAVKQVWLAPAVSKAEHQGRLARAAREARNAAKLRNHPHIVAVHDMVIENDIPWTVMRLVEGRSLEEHLRANGPLSAERAAEVAAALLDALMAAHAAGVIHRDVKPANVMLTTSGEVLLTDFGIAVHQTDTALTATGGIIGSPEYIAPERLNGDEGNEASDLFSLGVTLYQAVEGVSPFKRDTPTATLAAVVLHQAPRPQRAGALAPLISALLAKEPRDRPTIDTAVAMLHSGSPTATTTPRAPVTTTAGAHHATAVMATPPGRPTFPPVTAPGTVKALRAWLILEQVLSAVITFILIPAITPDLVTFIDAKKEPPPDAVVIGISLFVVGVFLMFMLPIAVRWAKQVGRRSEDVHSKLIGLTGARVMVSVLFLGASIWYHQSDSGPLPGSILGALIFFVSYDLIVDLIYFSLLLSPSTRAWIEVGE